MKLFYIPIALFLAMLAPAISNAEVKFRNLIELDCPGPGCPSIHWLATAELKVGNPVVQVGAFESFEAAIDEARRLILRFPSTFQARDGYGFFMERPAAQEKFYVRLRYGGFSDLSEARSHCVEMKILMEDCLPILIRRVDVLRVFEDTLKRVKLGV